MNSLMRCPYIWSLMNTGFGSWPPPLSPIPATPVSAPLSHANWVHLSNTEEDFLGHCQTMSQPHRRDGFEVWNWQWVRHGQEAGLGGAVSKLGSCPQEGG